MTESVFHKQLAADRLIEIERLQAELDKRTKMANEAFTLAVQYQDRIRDLEATVVAREAELDDLMARYIEANGVLSHVRMTDRLLAKKNWDLASLDEIRRRGEDTD